MGEKVHFWHGLKCHAARAACALVGGERRGIMTATPPYGGQSHEIPVISVYSRINPAFSRILPAVPGINRRGVVVIWCGRSFAVVVPPQRNDAVF
ncbi:hypothetical protein MLM10_011495 [Escherichia coli]|nr:hypothetical protein [Escherichia coli]SRT47820.1 Uncharacterised protein [Shigella sonnei]